MPEVMPPCANSCITSNRSRGCCRSRAATSLDRKSTRLNSSHLVISYAVFCLKKKIMHGIDHLPRLQDHDRRVCARHMPHHSTSHNLSFSLRLPSRYQSSRCALSAHSIVLSPT